MNSIAAHSVKIPGSRAGSPTVVPMTRLETVLEVFGTQQVIGRT